MKHDSQDEFRRSVGEKEKRKLNARKRGDRSLWFGLGMFGLVGWSFAIPFLLLLGFGIWLDSKTGGDISWTLTFLTIGVILGSLNAWLWVSRERKKIEEEHSHDT